MVLSRRTGFAFVCVVGAVLCALTDGVPPYAQPVSNCPEYGVFVYPHEKACDQYYKCENGTFTLEHCPNGLLFNDKSPVFEFCSYDWEVDCGERTERAPPISSPNCPWQWGIFPSSSCTQYFKCEWGYANLTDCEDGLAYAPEQHKCNWPDLVEGCDSEQIIGFKCPEKIVGPAAKFYPFPRYPYPHDCGKVIVCVNGLPRLLNCGYGSALNTYTLTCDSVENVPDCKKYEK